MATPVERADADLGRRLQEPPDVSPPVARALSTERLAHFPNLETESFVLEQHLHRDETILPNAKKLGMFRGTETVYARAAVVALKSEENWRRVGRVINDDDEAPMKWVKQRLVTINRKRAENVALEMGEEAAQQGLYAESQTKIFVPPPIKDVRALAI